VARPPARARRTNGKSQRIWTGLVLVAAGLIGLGLVYYWASVAGLNRELTVPRTSGPAELRPLPFPYRAAVGLTLAPEPGLDLNGFVKALWLVNTAPDKAAGAALGLEAGGSLLFYPPSPDWLAYFNPPGPEGDAGRRVLNALIRAGLVDVLDSYGLEADFSRESAERALAALAEQGLFLQTWADRFSGPDNLRLGDGRGASRGRLAYHLDLTLKAGFRFFWLGRTSRLIGQDAPVGWSSFSSLYRSEHPLDSLGQEAGVWLQHFLDVIATDETNARRANRLFSPIEFSDGNKAFEFVRYGPDQEPVELAQAFSRANLDRLVEQGGKMIIAGRLRPGPSGRPLPPEDEAALRRLAARRAADQVLVCTATRLLTYTRTWRYLKWRAEAQNGGVSIFLEGLDDPVDGPRKPGLSELAGLTFYVPSATRARIIYDGREMLLERHLIDPSGRETVSLPWPRLSLPELPVE